MADRFWLEGPRRAECPSFQRRLKPELQYDEPPDKRAGVMDAGDRILIQDYRGRMAVTVVGFQAGTGDLVIDDGSGDSDAVRFVDRDDIVSRGRAIDRCSACGRPDTGTKKPSRSWLSRLLLRPKCRVCRDGREMQ